jgi:prepilin-type N-terminal cleavage/methylation domain-containing protein
MKTLPRSRAGFSLLEIMIVVGVVALLAVLAVPNAMKSRLNASRQICISTLRQIESAKEQWAIENKKTASDTPMDADLFGLDKYLKFKPRCPEGGTYTIGSNSQRPICNIAGHTIN